MAVPSPISVPDSGTAEATLPQLTSNDMSGSGAEFNFPASNDYAPNMEMASTFTENMTNFAAMGLPSVALGAVDTLAQSFGADPTTVTNVAKSVLPALGNYYQQSQSWARPVGDLISAAFIGGAATKAVEGGSMLEQALTNGGKIPYISNLFANAKAGDAILADLYGQTVNLSASGNINPIINSTVSTLAQSYKFTQTANNLKQAVAGELAVAATMHASDTLYPSDSFWVNAAFPLAGAGLVCAAGYMAARKTIASTLSQAAEAGNAWKSIHAFQGTDFDAATGSLTFRPSDMSTGLALTGIENATIETRLADPDLANTNPELVRNLKSQQLQQQAIIQQQTSNFASQGTVYGLPGILPAWNIPQGGLDTVQNAMKINPLSIAGAAGIGELPSTAGGVQDLIDGFQSGLDDLKDQLTAVNDKLSQPKIKNKPDLLAQQAKLQSQVDQMADSNITVINSDGSITPAADRRPRASDSNQFAIKTVRLANQDEPDAPTLYTLGGPGSSTSNNLAVTSGFDVVASNNDPSDLAEFFNNQKLNANGLLSDEDLADADLSAQPAILGDDGKPNFDQISQTFLQYNKAISDWKPGQQIVLNNSSPWMKLDAISTLLEKNPKALQNLVLPPEAQQNPQEWIKWQSLQQKYQDYTQIADWRDSFYGTAKGSTASYLTDNISPQDMSYMLNLPGDFLLNGNSTMKAMESARIAGADELDDLYPSADVFKQVIQNDKQWPNIVAGIKDPQMKLRGGSMEAGPASNPVVMIRKNMQMDNTVQSELLRANQANYQTNLAALRGAASQNTMVGAYTQALDGLPETKEALQVNRLIGGTVQGDQDAISSMRANAWNPTTGAMDNINSYLSKLSAKKLSDLYATPLPGIQFTGQTNGLQNTVSSALNFARSDAGTGLRTEWGLFDQTRRLGWDVNKTPFTSADGRIGYQLADTARNKELMERYFPGTEWQDNSMLMPRLLPSDVEYTPLTVSKDTHNFVKTMNVLTDAHYNETNTLRAALGKPSIQYQNFWTPPVNLQKSPYVAMISKMNGEPATLITAKSAEMLQRLTDQEVANGGGLASRVLSKNDVQTFDDLHDRQLAGTVNYVDGLAQSGRATGATVTRTLQDPATRLQDALDGLNGQFQRLPARTKAIYFEPQVAQARQMLAISGEDPLKMNKLGDTSIWDRYQMLVNDTPTLRPKSPIGKVYSGVESLLDETLQRAHAFYMNSPIASTLEQRSNNKEFERLQSQLGPLVPFDDIHAYTQAVAKQSLPLTLKSILAPVSHITSMMAIRMLDVGNVLQNVMGTVGTLPAVIKALQPMTGESQAAWQTRTRLFSVPLSAEGKIGQFSSAKVLANAASDFWSAGGAAKLADADQHGLLDVTTSKLRRVLTGNAGKTWMGELAAHAEDFGSSLSYHGDKWSQQMAYLAGHNLAEAMGVVDPMVKRAWGNRVANMALGDYRVGNRPQIFQGTIGQPLGMYQTYMWNYYERMLGYIENKQYRALGAQFGLQAGMFGAKTLPGWDQFNEYIGTANQRSRNDSINFTDALAAHLGQPLADLVIHGAPSKLLGIDFGSRNDANLPNVPTIGSPGDAPVARMAKQIWNIIGDTYSNIRATGSISPQAFAESVARNSINRPLRGALELALGNTTDTNGNLVSGDIRNSMGVISRLISTRSLEESKNIQAFYQDSANRAAQELHMQRLAMSTRAAIRSNDTNSIKQGLIGYVDQGGDPRMLGRWFRNQAYAALVERDQSRFMQDVKNPSSLGDALRYTQAGVWHPNDPEFGATNPGQLGQSVEGIQ